MTNVNFNNSFQRLVEFTHRQQNVNESSCCFRHECFFVSFRLWNFFIEKLTNFHQNDVPILRSQFSASFVLLKKSDLLIDYLAVVHINGPLTLVK